MPLVAQRTSDVLTAEFLAMSEVIYFRGACSPITFAIDTPSGDEHYIEYRG